MSATVEAHYEGVRFAPSLRRAQPFQVLGFTESWDGNYDDSILIFMNLEQAKDLHNSLGVLINGVENE